MKFRRSPKLVLLSIIVITLLLINGLVLYAEPSNVTIEGEDSYFITGESNPTKIQYAGYNSRDDKLYINLEFETSKTVGAGHTATFEYYVEVFNGSGEQIGGIGTYLTPQQVVGADAALTATVTNAELTMTGDMTAANRTMAIVKNVTIS